VLATGVQFTQVGYADDPKRCLRAAVDPRTLNVGQNPQVNHAVNAIVLRRRRLEGRWEEGVARSAPQSQLMRYQNPSVGKATRAVSSWFVCH
jgi:hypothetical protein